MKTRNIYAILMSFIMASSLVNSSQGQSDDSLLTVDVDKRIELYFVTAFLSDSFFKKWINIGDGNYAGDIESHFSDFKSHPAVTFFEKTWKRDMSTYIPPEIMIYLSSDMEEQKHLKIPQEVADIMGGSDKKDEFIRNIKDFYEVTKFDEFFSNNQEYYTSICIDVRELMEESQCISKLTEFYGTPQNHFYAVVVPFLNPGSGYGPSLPAGNGLLDVYFLFSPFQDKGLILNQVWHEFGHSFVNPVVAKYSESVNEWSDLYKPIESYMQPLYPDWEDAFCEHLVRVNTTEMIKSEYGEASSDGYLQQHEAKGFIYMRPFTELMVKYQKKRKKYPTFESYLPTVIDKLKDLDPEEYLPGGSGTFSGSLNTVSKDVAHIIIPTNEVNDSIEAVIKDYCVRVKKVVEERNNISINIITDKEALESDVSGGDLWVYGTINGNLWLKDHVNELPFKIEADKIIADKIYEGDKLRYMSSWPHFQNKSRGMCIYSAQRAEDIWGIHAFNPERNDFVIINGNEIVGSGNYNKKKGDWKF